MKKLRLRTRISLNTVAVWTAFACVMIYAMMEHVSTTISAFSSVKMPLMYLGGLCLLTQTVCSLYVPENQMQLRCTWFSWALYIVYHILTIC